MAVVLKRPYNAVTLKQKFMRKQSSYEEIFSEDEDLRVWSIVAKIMRKTDDYMNLLRDDICGERFLRNVRYQVAFLTISRLFKTFTYSSNDIISFDIDRYTFDEVKKHGWIFRKLQTLIQGVLHGDQKVCRSRLLNQLLISRK